MLKVGSRVRWHREKISYRIAKIDFNLIYVDNLRGEFIPYDRFLFDYGIESGNIILVEINYQVLWNKLTLGENK